MATIFHALFGCCCGEREEDTNGASQPLLDNYDTVHVSDDPQVTVLALPGDDEERTLHLNQKVAELVQNGTGRMLSPALARTNGFYSPVLPPASSSQANLTGGGPRTPHTQRSQPESRHSSQSSRHSSYKQHQPSLVPHVESEGAPSEDAASALDALNANGFSYASYGGNKPRQQEQLQNYGTMGFGNGLGTTATARRFQIHRGRPPSRTKKNQDNNNDGSDNVSSRAEQLTSQTNGVQPSAESAHEVKETPTTETSLVPAEAENSLSTSSPMQINRARDEGSSSERGPDAAEKRKVHFELPPGDLILHYD